MDKVRLDFLKSMGGNLTDGDGIWCPSNGELIITEPILYLVNSGGFDCKGVEISNFTERKNKGVQPVPDGFPVVVTFKDGRIPGCKSSLAKDVDWENNYWYARWKPDYDKLLEMQKKHDAKQEKPIEELMINAKESKMSKNNKHPHHDLIVEWAKDTSKRIESKDTDGEYVAVSIVSVVSDKVGIIEFRFKPREFQKGHWYPVRFKCGDKDFMEWTGHGFEPCYEDRLCAEVCFEWIGESLGDIKFGGEE